MDVLYVEDNPADVRLLQAALRIAKYDPQIVVKEDGLLAIESFESIAKEKLPLPHVVLLDLNLPKVNGYEVLRYLKGNESLRAVPVIVFTGSTNPDDKTKSLALKADDFWTKPQDLKEALAIANHLKMVVEKAKEK